MHTHAHMHVQRHTLAQTSCVLCGKEETAVTADSAVVELYSWIKLFVLVSGVKV